MDKVGPVLWCQDLKVSFPDGSRPVRGVNVKVYPGQVLAIIGESGAGKTLLCRALYGLDVFIPGMEVQGVLGGTTARAMIFQDPGQYLNPGLSIEGHFLEFIKRPDTKPFNKSTQIEKKETMYQLLRYVGLPDSKDFVRTKPRVLSGGQQQRIMIALALAQNPKVLFADEAITALDGVNRKIIMELLRRLCKDFGLGIIFVTHDLHAADVLADWVGVMYAGRIVEYQPTQELFSQPKHPYTKALFKAHPGIEHRSQALYEIPGKMPGPDHNDEGCPFYPRCTERITLCKTVLPSLDIVEKRTLVACHVVHKQGDDQ